SPLSRLPLHDALPIFGRACGAPEAGFARADELLLNLRMIKSPAEIEMMRYSSHVSAEMLNAMFSQAAVGRTDGDLAAAGYDVARSEEHTSELQSRFDL